MARLLGAVVLFVAPFWLGAVARADQPGSLQAQIAAFRAQISASAGRVHQLTAAFDQANLTAGDTSQQLSADEATLASIRGKLAGSEAALRNSALQSYTGGTAGTVLDTSAAALDPAVSSAYIDVAVGNLSDSVDQFHLRQRQLEAAEAAVAIQQRLAEQAVTATRAARDAALGEAASAQGHLAVLQTQLDQLAAAQAAAAAAARSAAPPAPAQGGPVGNGLVSVVTAIVGAPVPSATPPPATLPAATTPPSPTSAAGGNAGGPWLQLRECESGNNYTADTGNGFYGAYQFSSSTWSNLGYPGRPDLESPAMQDAAAMKLQAEAGWGQWPACAAALGL